MTRVAVIIPALNEEASIGKVVAAVPRSVTGQILVIDNGSTDRTADVARAAGARVVQEPRPGYGAACWAGFQATDADVLVYLDGDWSDDPGEMPGVVGPVLAGETDLVIGTRQREPGALPPHAVLGNRLTTFLIRLLYGLRLSDLGSFRAIRREVLADLDMRERTYGWPVEMVVKAARKGYRVREVPVRYRRRIGKSKVAGTLRGSILAAWAMLATTFRHAFRR